MVRALLVVAALLASLAPAAACPFYIGCGCRAAIYVFHRNVRSLWPSQAWLRFPQTGPSPGMAAVRHATRRLRGHVVILKRHVSGSRWVVEDFNRGRSYEATRDIAGWTVVDPRG